MREGEIGRLRVTENRRGIGVGEANGSGRREGGDMDRKKKSRKSGKNREEEIEAKGA
jgi:hypothetical protein